MTMVADASTIKKLKSMVASKDAQVEALNGRIEVLMDDLVEARAERDHIRTTCFRLEDVVRLYSAAMLEKQIVVVCSNLGLLSACALGIVALVAPLRWQGLLIPVLPTSMSMYLEAPVPYIMGLPRMPREFTRWEDVSAKHCKHRGMCGGRVREDV